MLHGKLPPTPTTPTEDKLHKAHRVSQCLVLRPASR